jgi:hypothetical protein
MACWAFHERDQMNFRIILAGILLALSFCVAPDVSAHSTQPRVEISKERLNPGEVIDVRGVSFDMDEPVQLTLLGPGVEIPMGEALSDGEGDFLQILVLPADLAEGTYYIRATTNHHWVISPPLTVLGTAAVEGGGQGLRDDDDGLLAPMPTTAAPLPQPTLVSVAPVEERASVSRSTNLMTVLALLAVFVVIFGVGLRKRIFR